MVTHALLTSRPAYCNALYMRVAFECDPEITTGTESCSLHVCY